MKLEIIKGLSANRTSSADIPSECVFTAIPPGGDEQGLFLKMFNGEIIACVSGGRGAYRSGTHWDVSSFDSWRGYHEVTKLTAEI